MGFRDNAYNFSNDLQRVGSSLANAFIGNAQDDAAIALANYRDAQTVGQNQDNVAAQQLFDAGAALARNPQFQSVIARAMNLDTINPQFMGPPSDSQIRTGTPAAGNLARTFLGEYGNAEQMAGAASAYGDAGASRMFESMIAGGDADAMRRGFIGLGNNPTKYFDQGVAQSEVANDLRVGLDNNQKALLGDMYSAETVLEAALNEDRARYEEGGLGDRDNIREQQTARELGLDLNGRRERWERYKADQTLVGTRYKADADADAAMYGANLDASVARDKNVMADNTVRWKHKNRTIEMAVEPGKVIVLDPDTADRLGIAAVNDTNSKYNGLHIIDGGPKPGQVVVKVGREDVYMDKATADALGIPKDDDGKYVVEGAGYKEDKSTRNAAGGGDVTISTTDDNALLSAVDTAYTNNDFDLPDAVARAVRNKLVTEAVAQMGSKKNITTGRTFISKQLKKGFVTVEASVPGMFNDIEVDVPVFLIEEMNGATGVQAVDDAVKALDPAVRRGIAKTMLERLGYSPEEADAIVSQQVK